MKILATAHEVNDTLCRLVKQCQSCQIAVAWASTGTKPFDRLRDHQDKIERMVVGTHFYQTDPAFIETFMQHANVRFVRTTDGVFHPKMYFFTLQGESWACVIGSPNFTGGGLGGNEEVATLITDADDGADEALSQIMSAISRYWQLASPISEKQLEAYRQAWRRRRRVLKNLAGKFGEPDDDSDDNGKHPLDVDILQMPWKSFFSKVKSEEMTSFGHSMGARLQVIQAARQLFQEYERFGDIPPEGRKKIAGLLKTPELDYRLFGSMLMTVQFKAAVNSQDERLEGLSHALDAIPLEGIATRADYLKYISRFRDAFPKGGAGLATATRLLAMKRPDTFVCIDDKNETELCKDFEIRLKEKHKYEQYWDLIIERIRQEAVWWSSPEPESGDERLVWQARTAFLDSHYYKEKDAG